MTFHNINENRHDITGHFGSGQARNVRQDRQSIQRKASWNIPKFNCITAERWVDIICISLIFVFLLSALLDWNNFLDLLFISVLFPVISVGAKLLGIITGIAAVFGFIYVKLRGPRRWH